MSAPATRWLDLARAVEERVGEDPTVLYPVGDGERCPCPIHGGDGPSFAVYDGRWSCFSRHASGGPVDFIAQREGWAEHDERARGEVWKRALLQLAEQFGIDRAHYSAGAESKAPKGRPYPPRAQVDALLLEARAPARALRWDEDPSTVHLTLGGRARPGIADYARLDALDPGLGLVRILERAGDPSHRPEWAHPWSRSTVALFCTYSARGEIVSARARPLVSWKRQAKSEAPKGFAAGDVLANRPARHLLQGRPARSEVDARRDYEHDLTIACEHGIILTEGEPAWLAWASWHPGPVLGIPGKAPSAAVLARLPADAPILIDVDPDEAGGKYLKEILARLPADRSGAVRWSYRTSWYAEHQREPSQAELEADPRLCSADERDGREGVVGDGAGWTELPAEAREPVGVEALEDPGAWAPPLPMGRDVRLGAFPVEVLPGWVRDFVVAEARAVQCPVDMPAAFATGALAAVTGGRARVRAWTGFEEATNLYIAVAMPPASIKSPVHRHVVEPITRVEDRMREEAKGSIAKAAARRSVLEKRLRRAEDAAAKAPDRDLPALLTEVEEARHQLDEATVPPPPRLLVDDSTPEQLKTLLHDHGGRLAMLSAESALFGNIASQRYSKAPNLEAVLAAHAGDRILVDRRGREERIDDPRLTICVAVQPRVLADAFACQVARDRGLFARFLYCVPDSNIGDRDFRGLPEVVPPAVSSRWSRNLESLGEAMRAREGVLVLELDDDARVAFQKWRGAIEPRRRASGDLAGIIDWAGKMDGALLRLAGVLHLAEAVEGAGPATRLGAETLGRAVRLLSYFEAHAHAAYDAMGADEEVDRARKVLAWVKSRARDPDRAAAQGFPREDLQRAFSGRMKAEELDAALSDLVSRGWVRVRVQATGGRPKRVYQWHPDLGGGDARESTAETAESLRVPPPADLSAVSAVQSYIAQKEFLSPSTALTGDTPPSVCIEKPTAETAERSATPSPTPATAPDLTDEELDGLPPEVQPTDEGDRPRWRGLIRAAHRAHPERTLRTLALDGRVQLIRERAAEEFGDE